MRKRLRKKLGLLCKTKIEKNDNLYQKEDSKIYNEYKSYLYKMALKNKNKFGDFDETLGYVNEAFCKALRTFDKNKNAKFITHLYYQIHGIIDKYYKKQKSHNGIIEKYKYSRKSFFTNRTSFIYKKGFSKSAIDVIDLILNELIYSDLKKISKYQVQKYLMTNKGWTQTQCALIFNEITMKIDFLKV